MTKKYSDVDVYQPITPNLLLLGRCSTTSSSPNLDGDLLKRLSYVKDLEDTWWDIYYRQVLFNRLPYVNDKAAKNHTNLEVGDVCLAFYDNKVSKGDYRMCLVAEVFPDDQGIVRDVNVLIAPCQKNASLAYKSKKLKELQISVQRLVLLPTLSPNDEDETSVQDAAAEKLEEV